MTDNQQETTAPLAPCPFCGSDVKLDVQYGPAYDLWDLYIVRCIGCFTETEVLRVHRNDPRDAKAEAQAKWNRRTPAPDGWQPIETAPKDGTKILVYFDASSDPYHADDEGKLTPFGAHAEGGDFLDGSGVCVAAWVKSWSEPLDEYSSVRIPGWWFAWFNGDTEYVVAPTHWMPLPQPPAEGEGR